MSEQLKNAEQNLSDGKNDEIHLFDILTALARQKKILFYVPCFALILAVSAAFLIKPRFSSTAVLLPPQQQNSGMSAVLGQLSGLAGAAGSIAGVKNPSDVYIAMLESRTISDKLIAQFDLRNRLEAKTLDDAREKLKNVAVITGEKTGTISIVTQDSDPVFAANLANAYVTELSSLTKKLAITDAAQRRLFFEKQLVSVKNDLANAEIELRQIQEKTGMLELEGQVKGIISGVAQLEGTITAKEVQLSAMRSFATINNPDLQRLQNEIQGYRAQLEKLKSGKTTKEGDIMVPTGKIPEIGVEYIRGLRNVKYQETIFELLAKQYELAKIDEARESSTIQVLDEAVPAQKKSKPKKLIIVSIGVLGGIILALFLALLRDAYQKSTKNEQGRHRWILLANAWKNKNI